MERHPMTEQLDECARIALTDCLGLGRREKLLVVCDPPCAEIGDAFFRVGASMCREAVMVCITPRKQNGNEPPDPVGAWFGQFDVAVMPTSRSLSHTQARRKACASGTRVATLPGITADIFTRTLRADWKKLGIATRRIAAQLSGASRVRVSTRAGTDFSFETGGRPAKPDDGRILFKGAFGNLPAGEAYLAPLEGTAEGTLVVDGSFPIGGLLNEPLVVHVHKGKVADIEAHQCRDELEQLFKKYGSAGRNIAEFGVGTLDSARISGNTLEDEKVKGTCHVAFGDNASMGGTVKVPMHLDGIVKNPTVWLDDKMWIRNGEMV
jgi:leucyl aminopeptidase (aminopeptidase T)